MEMNVKKIIMLAIMIYSIFQICTWGFKTNLWDDPRNIIQAYIAFYTCTLLGAFMTFRTGKWRYLVISLIVGVLALRFISFQVRTEGAWVPH